MESGILSTDLKVELSKSRLEACKIDTWMLLNKLKLNKDKIELLVISSLHRARPPLSHIHVCDERVLASPRAGNIGVLFDESLSMVPQVTAMCSPLSIISVKLGSFINISPLMQPSFLFKLLFTSKLDYCNSLLYGLPEEVIKQLQRVQNAAARVVTLSLQVLSYYTCSCESSLALDLSPDWIYNTYRYFRQTSPWTCSCLY